MQKVTLITAFLIFTTSFASFAGNSNTKNSLKSTEITTKVNSENKNADVVSLIKLNDVTIENSVSYLEKYQLRKSTSSKSKLHNVQNFLKNPEQRKIMNKAILC